MNPHHWRRAISAIWLRDARRGSAAGARRHRRPAIEPLESRQLLASTTVTPVPITATAFPTGTTGGPDGNVWFTEYGANKIAMINPTTRTVTESAALPTAAAGPVEITTGPDGNLWFTEQTGNKIGMINPKTMAITESAALPTANSEPQGITTGPDGNLWFTEYASNKIGMINPKTMAITEFTLPTANSQPYDIAAGPDGNLWFTEYVGNKIGMINPTTHTFTESPALTTANSQPQGITLGPDGNLWFTEYGNNKVARIVPKTLAITEYTVPTPNSDPDEITMGPDGNLWFTEHSIAANKVGTINPTTGGIADFPIGVNSAQPVGITAGSDGNLWLAEPGGVGANLAVASPATDLTVASQPPSFVTPGGPFGLTVTLNYLTGPVDTGYNGPVTIALVNPGGAALGGTLTATAKNGVATFSGLSINQAGRYQIVAYTDPLTTTLATPMTVAVPPTIVTEKLLYAGKGRRRHVVAIELDYSTAMDPTRVVSMANYTLSQFQRKGRQLATQPVAYQAAYNATAHSVTLTLAGNPKFAAGGRLVVVGVPTGGVTDATGVPLDGGGTGAIGDNGTFVIATKGKSISR